MMEKEVTIHGLIMDPKNNSPVILLREMDGDRALPIWIGLFEANAIATKLAGMEPPRPLTHDLLLEVLNQGGLTVQKITVTELRENTFYARITITKDSHELELDSRPSDALALAVRIGCPIFVSQEVLDRSAVDVASLEILTGDQEKDELTELLEKLDPEDFSKYKM